MHNARRGFTLVELLITITIIGILAAIVIIAINPTKQLDEAQDAKRSASVREIENAITQYIIDGNQLTGLPASINTAIDICQTTVTGAACTDAPVSGYDLSDLSPEFIVSIPIDPEELGATITGYRIYISGSFIKVCNTVLDANCGA